MKKRVSESFMSGFRRYLTHEAEHVEAEASDVVETTSAKEMLLTMKKFMEEGSAVTIQKTSGGFRVSRSEKISI